jgi:signal transduction histidine kinase
MIALRNLSIPKKIITIIMIITAAALLMAGGALIAYDFVTERDNVRAGAAAFARIVADNTSAAVSFKDPDAAVDTLNSLRFEPSIVAACIHTPEGLFAEYAAAGSPRCPKHPPYEPEESGYLWVSAPIDLGADEVGTVRLRATLEPAYAHLRLEIATIAGILLISSLFAFALSSRLHKLVSEPILSLARTANDVSRWKDYSIRATKQGQDELGTLVDSFNEMLSQIQARQADLQERTEELVQASRMKDEFLATLSHELRTPLNSILGWSVLIQSGRLPAEREKSALQAIERNARVQSKLIEDLLDVSRIISGKFTLEVEVRLVKTDRHARISVADDGIGIAPEFLPFVFDRFRQADGSSTRAHGGLGLGLAIVRHIIEMHGGSVAVESKGTGKGAKFTIELPLLMPQTSAAVPALRNEK